MPVPLTPPISGSLWIQKSLGPSETVVLMVDGEEQLFDPKHPVWRIILVAILGLLVLGDVDVTHLITGILGGA